MRFAPLKPIPHECSYLPPLTATYESYLVVEAEPGERQGLLESGYRSFGKHIFRPICLGCHRCLPLRVPVAQFSPSKSQRRVLRKCANVRVIVDKPEYTPEKMEIYRDHLTRFPSGQEPMTEDEFLFSFYDPDVATLEFLYFLDDTLAAIGFVHITAWSLSSVYFAYRLQYAKLSLGTFSVLQEIAYAKAHNKEHLYLGYTIRDNRYMAYKVSFCPNEILTRRDEWIPFRNARGRSLIDDPDPRFAPFPYLVY